MLFIVGWSLGEHQEWSKYSNFEVSVQVPLIIYVPGVTAPKVPTGQTFPFVDPFQKEIHNNKLKYTKSFETDFGRMNQDLTDSDGNINKRTHKKSIIQHKKTFGTHTDELVELVDIFPSLVELSGLGSLQECPLDSSKSDLCTEGHSFADIVYYTSGYKKWHNTWKNATFSQYPRPSVKPQNDSDKPRLKNIKIMGYSMRTTNLRYTEWIGFDPTAFHGNWSDVKGQELYLYDSDPHEDHNVAGQAQYASKVEELSALLQKGWRNALTDKAV